MNEISEAEMENIRRLLVKNGKIAAIRSYREAAGAAHSEEFTIPAARGCSLLIAAQLLGASATTSLGSWALR